MSWGRSWWLSKNCRNLIVFAYPVYCSFAELKTGIMDHEAKWLTYWILFALSCVLDSMPFVHYIIPYFSLVRFVFLFLCMIPQVDVGLFDLLDG